MGFKAGNPGRPRGAINKATKDVRAAISLLAENLIDEVEDWIRQIDDPAKRVDCFNKMLEYHTPKLSRSEVTGKDGAPLAVNIMDPTRRGPAP